VIYEELCLLYFGPGERRFLIALDKQTGEPVWRKAAPAIEAGKRTDGFRGRDNGVTGSFSTPLIIQAEDRDELVMSFAQQLRAYAPRTGEPLWSCDGLNPLVYTSPIYREGVVVAMGGFKGTTVAVEPGGEGDVTGNRRLWMEQRTRDRLGSGVIHEGHIYVLDTPGIAVCMELRTGEEVWEHRLPAEGPKSESWSSMVLSGERIYILNQSGDTIVLKASPEYEVLAVNSLGYELTNASLAVAHGNFYIRTHEHLWCIGNPATAAIDPK
jgi:outer membrane protein assembly factor BamB